MAKLLVSLLAVLGLGFAAVEVATTRTLDMQLEGEVDLDMYNKVLGTLKYAKAVHANKLVIDIVSPGGNALLGAGMSRDLRKASDEGLVVEIHAHDLCASMCTFLLGSGTPGYRYIESHTVYLVHPMQVGSMFGPPECMDHVKDTKDVSDKLSDMLIKELHRQYQQFSGKDKATVDGWLTCGQEQVEGGELAVKLGLADKVE